MAWTKEEIKNSEQIFNEIVSEYGEKWNDRIGDSTCPYEYFADHLRDNYDLTFRQCNEVCEMIKEHYNIEHFYYTELKEYKKA